MVYANVGQSGPRARIGDTRDLHTRWLAAVEDAKAQLSPKDPNCGCINLACSEKAVEFINDAIEKSKQHNWDAEVAVRDPDHDAILSEMYLLRRRYHDCWLEIDDLRRTLVFKKDNASHRILQDLPRNWDVQPDKIGDHDFRRKYPTYRSAKIAAQKLLDAVLQIESWRAQLRAVVNFEKAEPLERHEKLIIALGRRVEALEAELCAMKSNTKGK